jgi:putative DNA primase/helicase
MSAKHDPEAAMHAAGVRDIPARDSGVLLIRADQVKSERVAWLWQGWLARAKVHIFAGDPGAGKTTIALDLAAIITRGGRLPDGTQAEPGDVLFWSGEDDIADTLKPRLARAEADLSRVHFVAGVSKDGKKRAFDPAMDMAELSEAIGRMQRPAMLVMDPVVVMVTGEGNGSAPVRRDLQPLADLATERRVAVLGITHLSKGTQGRKPLERVTGSLVFGALARIVFFAARGEGKDGSEPERLLVRVKSNIGPDGDGFRYSLEQAPLADDPSISASGIVWGEAVEGRAGDLLAKLEGLEPGKGDGPLLSEAKDFLQDMLADGPMGATALAAEAKDFGISSASLKRAKQALGVQSEKAAGDGPWRWRLPERSP